MITRTNDSSRRSTLWAPSAEESQRKTIHWVGAGLQLVAIVLCLDTLLGISYGLSPPLRIFLLMLIAASIVLRLGWLALVALQLSLIVLEPRQMAISPYPIGFFYATSSLIVIVAAMKLPEYHRHVTDYVSGFFLIDENASNSQDGFVLGRVALSMLKMVVIVVVAGSLLSRLPIGSQSESWLEWSRQNGQAVWPGALLLVLMLASLVLAREFAWRQLGPSQASLYLRSVQLIANYRDLFGFERHRLRRLRKARWAETVKTPQPIKRPKLRRNRQVDTANAKGLK